MYRETKQCLPHLVLRVELDLEELGAIDLAPCALADDLGGEHEVLLSHEGSVSQASAAKSAWRNAAGSV